MSNICTTIKSSIPEYFECSGVEIDGFLMVTTPFLYLDGGVVCVYIKEFLDYIILTDMGDLNRWLHSYSMTGDLTDKQNLLMHKTLNYHGISMSRGMLVLKIGTNDNITESMLSMAQAIARISDVNYLIVPKIPNSFNNNFKDFLDRHGLNYEIDKPYTGNSGRDRKVDFWVKEKEKISLVYTLSLSKTTDINAKSDSVFSKWSDLLYLKKSDESDMNTSINFVSLINDELIEWPQSNINLLRTVSSVERWTNKNKLITTFSSS